MVVTTYAYDPAGKRVTKSDGTTTTVYPNQYYDSDGTTPTKQIYAPEGTLLASVEGTGGSAAVKTVHTDHLGGTNVVTDASGAAEQLLSYYPFGATRLDEKSGAFSERNKFTGHEYDSETGLYYMQARYQSPEVGRFASQDPRYIKAKEQHLEDPQQDNSGGCCTQPCVQRTYILTR